MIPDFQGFVIETARIEYGLRLSMRDRWEFMLAEPVVVTTTDAVGVHQTTIDVDVAAQELPQPLQGLEGAVIESALVSRDGDLGIHLVDRHLAVRASPDYEAWQVTQGGGERFICGPGGEMVHFPPLRR